MFTKNLFLNTVTFLFSGWLWDGGGHYSVLYEAKPSLRETRVQWGWSRHMMEWRRGRCGHIGAENGHVEKPLRKQQLGKERGSFQELVKEMGIGDSSGAPWAPSKPSESFRQGNIVRKNVPKRWPWPPWERDSEERLGVDQQKGSGLWLV